MADDKTDTKQTESGDETAEPKYLTVEDFNKAASSRDRRLEAKLEKLLSEKLASLITAAPTPAADATPAEASKADRESDARIKAMEAKMADSEARAKNAEDKRAREEESRLLSDALAEKGITGARQKAAMALLREEAKISRDSEGRVVFHVQREGYVDPLDVAAGIDEWVKGDGREFLPARGVSGSGAEGGKGPRPAGNGKPTKADLGLELMKFFSGNNGS
jgi:hypothetical protein